MKKKLMIALSYVLILALGIAGTIAYLTNQAEVVNTFELDDDVEITLDEAPVIKDGDIYKETTGGRVVTNTYSNVYPGAVMPKDPTVHLSNDASTADAYVKAVVTIPGGAAWLGTDKADLVELTGDTIGANWRFMDGKDVNGDVVYSLIYTVRMTPGSDTTPVFEKIVFPSEYDTAEITQYFGTALKFDVKVNAYSIQAAGFTDAIQAFGVKEGTMDIWDGEVNEGLDTTAATVEVATAEDLAAVAAAVRAGDSLGDSVIKLTKDIDLAGMNWTPIGRMINTSGTGDNSTFKGVFDGQGYTIYNMTVDTTADADHNNKGAGFFGALTGSVKNLHFVNATVKTAHWAGVVAGSIEGSIENCTVENVNITCLPEQIGGEWDNGDKAGAIVGYATNGTISNCAVTNATITAYRDLGAIAGASYNSVSNCTVENVTLIKDNTHDYKGVKDDATVNAYVGTVYGGATITGTTGAVTIQ